MDLSRTWQLHMEANEATKNKREQWDYNCSHTLSSAKLRDFQPPMKISNGLHFRDPRLNFAAAGVIVNSPLWRWPITDVAQTMVVCISNSPW